MISVPMKVDLDTRTLREMKPVVKRRLGQAIVRGLKRAKIRAQERVPKQTTSAQQSIYVQHQFERGYVKASTAAKAVNPRVRLLTEEPVPDTVLEGLLAVAAAHAAIIEGGSVKRPARPFIAPSVQDEYAQTIIEMAQEIDKGVVEAGGKR